MSRGPGHVMRAVQARLTYEPQTLAELAEDIFDQAPPTRSQIESVGRAVRRLRAQNQAWIYEPEGSRRVEVRLPLTAEEVEELFDSIRGYFSQPPRGDVV